jgi:hypothetical protein
LHGALLCARADPTSSQAERGRGGSRAPVRRAVPVIDRPRPPYQSCFQPKVIVEMKRQQASFSVEIKKSRTQRQQLPPRPLFATPPDETSAFIRKAEPQPVAEPVVAPRILPSILAPVSNRSEPVEPVRSKRAVRSKAEQSQIQLDLYPDGARNLGSIPDTPSRLERGERGLPMDIAPMAQEDMLPLLEVRIDDIGIGERKARVRRKKPSEFVALGQEADPASQPPPAPADLLRSSAFATSPKAMPARLTKRHAAAAQLPRNERWKRRLHPATW